VAVLVKTKLATDLQLDKDEPRLDFSCGGDLKVIVTVEPAETGNNSICTARGDATPPGEVASDFIGNDPGPRFMEYIRATESLLFNDYLIRAIRLFMWRRGARVDYRLPYNGDGFWSLDGYNGAPSKSMSRDLKAELAFRSTRDQSLRKS
jgi:hypothetical protein